MSKKKKQRKKGGKEEEKKRGRQEGWKGEKEKKINTIKRQIEEIV